MSINQISPMRGFIFLLAFVISSSVLGQTKVKNAYKQLTKGDYAKASQLLSEVKSEDIRLEFYYVRALCNLQTANTKEAFFSIYEDLQKGDPAFEKDPKEIENLLKDFDLNEYSYDAAESKFFESAFNFYKGLDQTEAWKDHNEKYASSPLVKEAYNLESLAALRDALANGGDSQKLNAVYLDYKGMEASSKAYDAWGELEFKAVTVQNSSESLRKFSSEFSLHARSKEAFALARSMDYKVAMADLTIPALEKFLSYYEEGEEHKSVFNVLDSLYHKDLILNFKDVSYEAYAKKFTEGPRRLELDSLFNQILFENLNAGNWEYVKDWHKKIKRSTSSFGYDQVNRLTENLEIIVLPYLEDRNSYSLGSVSGRPLSGEAANFKSKTILRDGDALFRYQIGDKWGILYLDGQGKVNQLTQPIYDQISALNKQVYQVTINKPDGNDLNGYLNVLGEYVVPLGNYDLITLLGNGNILAGNGTSFSLIHPLRGKVQSFSTRVELTDGIFADGLLAEYSAGENISALYSYSGKLLAKGTSISVKNLYQTINLKIDGKSFLVFNDSLISSPSTELISYYLDSKNFISSKNPDEGKYSITSNGIKGSEMSCDYFDITDKAIIFNLTAGGHKIVSKQNLSKVIDNVKTLSVLGEGYLTSNSSGEVQFVLPNQDSFNLIPLPYVNTPEYGEEFYGGDEYLGDGYEGEGGSEIFWINDLEVQYHSISNPRSTFSWTNKVTDLMPVEIGPTYGYINQSGELKIPSQYSYASEYDGWVAQVMDEEFTQFLIDKFGNTISEGYVVHWVNPNTFLYSEGNAIKEFTSNEQSAANGKITEICSNCSIRQVIGPGIYEVDLDNFVGYVTNKNNKTLFLGKYLSTPYRKFKVNYDKLAANYWASEYDYYDFSQLIDELNAPSDLKYSMSLVKLRVALDKGFTDFSSILDELNSYNNFNLEEKESVYSLIAQSLYETDNYYEAASYFNELKRIMNYDRFIENYGLIAAYTYSQINDRAQAKKIYESYIPYDEINSWDNLGHIYFDESNYDMAIKSWYNALTAAKSQNNEFYWNNGNVFLNLGAAYANQNNRAQMCQNFKAAMGFGNEEATRRYNNYCK